MLEKIQIMCGDFADAVNAMSDEGAGKLFKAIFAYASDDDPGEIINGDGEALMMFFMLKSHIDRLERHRAGKAESGRKGGYSKAKQNVANCSKVKQNVANVSKDVANSGEVKQSLPPNPYPNPYPNPNNYIVTEIVDYLNEKTKSHYQAKGKTMELINGRGNDGFTVDDFKKVIDKKVKEWTGTPYEKFIRPSTLFAPGHFEEYLNQPERVSTSKPNTFTSGVEKRDINFDELEKKLIKN